MTRDHARLPRRQFLVGATALGGAAVGLGVLGGLAPWPGPRAVPLIGYVSPIVGHSASTEAFREGLREYGLVEGENIRVEWRFAAGQPERLPALVAELLESGVRIVVTGGATPAQAARRVTDSVPIVMIEMPEPIASGWAASYAQPGGNVTGIRGVAEGTLPKSIELLVEIVPKARRLAYLRSAGLTGPTHQAVADAAARAGLELLVVQVETETDLEPAVDQARTWGADLLTALYVIPLNVPVERLPILVRRARLPASGHRAWVEAGLLLSYDVDRVALYRRGAWYVARILAGAQPGDLPVEQADKFELVVNRTTLQDLGLTLPEHVAPQVTQFVA